MEEVERALTLAEKDPLDVDELWRVYSRLKDEIEDLDEDASLFETLRANRTFRTYLRPLLDVERRRPDALTNELGVAVDPAYVISELDASIRKISREAFDRVRIPLYVQNNLFETSFEFADSRRGFRDPEFDFGIDWSDDLGTAQAFFGTRPLVLDAAAGHEEDADLYEMYLAFLLLSYLYHRRLYEGIGVDSLEKFWTEYSLDRRQGAAARSLEEASWTVRVRGAARPEEDPGEWEAPLEGLWEAFPPPPPPALPDEERRAIEIGRAEVILKQEVAAVHAYRARRTDWQADPSDDVAFDDLRAAKAALDGARREATSAAKRVRAIFREGGAWKYAEGRELKNVVSWHKIYRRTYADAFLGGFASSEEDRVPPLRMTRDDELRNLTLS